MFKSIKLLTLVGVIATVAACGGRQEEVVVAEPITVEPTFDSKYK